jgi:hypothetical protein
MIAVRGPPRNPVRLRLGSMVHTVRIFEPHTSPQPASSPLQLPNSFQVCSSVLRNWSSKLALLYRKRTLVFHAVGVTTASNTARAVYTLHAPRTREQFFRHTLYARCTGPGTQFCPVASRSPRNANKMSHQNLLESSTSWARLTFTATIIFQPSHLFLSHARLLIPPPQRRPLRITTYKSRPPTLSPLESNQPLDRVEEAPARAPFLKAEVNRGFLFARLHRHFAPQAERIRYSVRFAHCGKLRRVPTTLT